MAKQDQSPPRCVSCGSAIALDKLKDLDSRSKRSRSFDDWEFCDPDIARELLAAKFVGPKSEYARADILRADCRYPFSSVEGTSPFGNTFNFNAED